MNEGRTVQYRLWLLALITSMVGIGFSCFTREDPDDALERRPQPKAEIALELMGPTRPIDSPRDFAIVLRNKGGIGANNVCILVDHKLEVNLAVATIRHADGSWSPRGTSRIAPGESVFIPFDAENGHHTSVPGWAEYRRFQTIPTSVIVVHDGVRQEWLLPKK